MDICSNHTSSLIVKGKRANSEPSAAQEMNKGSADQFRRVNRLHDPVFKLTGDPHKLVCISSYAQLGHDFPEGRSEHHK